MLRHYFIPVIPVYTQEHDSLHYLCNFWFIKVKFKLILRSLLCHHLVSIINRYREVNTSVLKLDAQQLYFSIIFFLIITTSYFILFIIVIWGKNYRLFALTSPEHKHSLYIVIGPVHLNL